MIDHASERDQWLEARRAGIGSSDAPSIMGLSPWATPLDVWLDKTGRGEPVLESAAMRAGTLLEPLALDLAAAELGQTVTPHDQSVTLEHPTIPVLRCTPDGYAEDGWIIECKCTGDAPWEEVPIHYAIQVQHQLAVTGAPGAYVAQLSRGRMTMTLHAIPRHDAMIARLERDLPAWWERHVVAGVAPEPSTMAEVVRLHPEPSVPAVRLPDDAAALLDRLDEIRSASKALSAEERALKLRLARTMANAEVGLLADGRAVTYRTRAGYTTAPREVAPTRILSSVKRWPKGIDADAAEVRDLADGEDDA